MNQNKVSRLNSIGDKLIEDSSKEAVLEWPTPTIPLPKVLPISSDNIDYLPLILNARVYDVAIESPLQYARKLSAKLESTIYLKREDLQPIYSFKCRGAFNKMFRLTPEQKRQGVSCVSAGNHAQGVALAAQKLGLKATIVMPTFAPEIKVENVRRLGAKVVLFGNDFDDAKKECARLTALDNLTFIPPFDDPLVIAGQGTCGMEILNQIRHTRLDAIFVCCGGGGLLAGISAFVKRVRPEVKVIGVNTVDSDSMLQSLCAGKPVLLERAGLFSDGTSVKLVGNECVRLCKQYVDDIVKVNNDEICAAIKDCYEESRSILEPAGALGVAGVKKYINSNPALKGGVFAAVCSGANMNFDRLRFVAERAAIGEGKEALLSVLLPEKPGTLKILNETVSHSITELSYRYADGCDAHVFLGFQTVDLSEVEVVINDLTTKDNFKVLNITENIMASQHIRYMCGGRSSAIPETLFRLRLPERPGALKDFFEIIERDWNITLFHYRNHGADYGRVLVGFLIPEVSQKKLDSFTIQMAGCGIKDVVNETSNPVYKQFM